MKLSEDGRTVMAETEADEEALHTISLLIMVNQNRKNLGRRPQSLEEIEQTPEVRWLAENCAEGLRRRGIPLTIAEAGDDDPDQAVKEAVALAAFHQIVEAIKPAVQEVVTQAMGEPTANEKQGTNRWH